MAPNDLSLQERKQELVRTELFNAAWQLFGERGYEATTVAEIAAAAGVSRRTFFRYYASKEDVLVETSDDIFAVLRPLAGVLAPALQAAGPGQQNPATAGPVLDKAYEILLDALGFEPASVDVLVVRTGLAADEVASMLLILELDGKLESRPGGRYLRRVLKAAK